MIPDLGRQGNREAWYRLEVAKRRLIYSLLELGLPLEDRQTNPEQGLVFEFLEDSGEPGALVVLTGHNNGKITINIAEADDAEREKRRVELREPYRTLLGHFRHEIGHYYWDRLIRSSSRVDAFRGVFGDERMDYGQSLQRHYEQGAVADWQDHFVSAYASVHPWEDWAETWAHYLHITDVTETAEACGLSLKPVDHNSSTQGAIPEGAFDRLIANWYPLTFVLNNLNRSLGLSDGYPFVLSPEAIVKLRFVHETIALYEQSP
jgi:hypothetical protein